MPPCWSFLNPRDFPAAAGLQRPARSEPAFSFVRSAERGGAGSRSARGKSAVSARRAREGLGVRAAPAGVVPGRGEGAGPTEEGGQMRLLGLGSWGSWRLQVAGDADAAFSAHLLG